MVGENREGAAEMVGRDVSYEQILTVSLCDAPRFRFTF
jgi:hypothetical protein